MTSSSDSDTSRRAAAEQAVTALEDGMVVGLGTGTTAAHVIRTIGDAVSEGCNVRGIPTSFQARTVAEQVGIPLVRLSEVSTVDLAIDGADQVDADGNLIKGGGAAHTREKILANAADEFVVVVGAQKKTSRLDHVVPIAVLPDAHSSVANEIRGLGGEPTLRSAEYKDGPLVTENGNLVVDAAFGQIADPVELATELSTIPGVVEHGLFVNLVDELYVGSADGVERQQF